MGNAVTVYLIRHERTKGNLERKYVGWSDEHIVTLPREYGIPIETDVVYGSDLLRCKETAGLYFPKAEFIGYPQLREMNFGNFEMKTYNQLQHEPLYRKWIENPFAYSPPNGETFKEFAERITSCFHDIVQSGGTYVFIVHGGVIRLLISMFYHQDLYTFQQVQAKHQMIYSLRWNDISSLKEGRQCESFLVEPIMEKEHF